MEVLPVPRVPQKRYAWAMRPEVDRLLQRLRNVILPDDFIECSGAISAGEDGVGHQM